MAAVDFKERLLAGLGGYWPQPCPLLPKLHETKQAEGFRIEKISYQAEPDDRVPALLLIPDKVTTDSPSAAICLWHQHNGQWHLGKSEPAGLAGNPMHHTGAALAREGFVVLCPDALGFEERQLKYKLQGGKLERYLFLKYIVQGKCMAWKNILDMRRAVDYLVSRAEVKADAIGCYGHSMGSTHAWLIGPWEERLGAFVCNCCLPTYAGIHREELLHCFPNFIPGIYPHGDTPDIAGLIAPRPLQMNFGEKDSSSPIDEVRRGVKTIAQAYQAQHAEKNFSYYIEDDAGHVLSDTMWKKTKEFFIKHLIKSS